MKICPKCNAQLADDAVFCTGCGQKMEEGTTAQTANVCKNCGSPLSSDTQFCTKCSTPVVTSPQPTPQAHSVSAPRQSPEGDSLKKIIAAFVVLLACGSGWYFYNESKVSSSESTLSITENSQNTATQETRNGKSQTNADAVQEHRYNTGSIYDHAKLLSADENEQLAAEIKRVEQQHGVRIGIITQPSLQGRDIGKVANAILDQGFRGATNGGIVLLINMEKREWYISTDNAMRARVTDGEGIKYIQERMVPKISKGQYSGGFRNYVSAVEKMVTYYAKYGKPFKQ